MRREAKMSGGSVALAEVLGRLVCELPVRLILAR